MKLLIFSLAAMVIGAVSCGDHSSGATGAAVAGAGSSGDDHGPGTFTYTIDGTKYALQLHPEAATRPTGLYINYAFVDTSGKVSVEITSMFNSDLFKFKVAPKGTTDVIHYRPAFESNVMSAEYLWYKTGANYYADSVKVTIKAADATHIEGSFSGSFTSDRKRGTIRVTDGAFDLPITKDK